MNGTERENVRARAREIADAAPPLSEAQRERIAALLRPIRIVEIPKQRSYRAAKAVRRG